MMFESLSGNPRFSRALLTGGSLTALVLINSIFVIGGEYVFQVSTSLLSPIVALGASFLCFYAREITKESTFQWLWLCMGVGFGLWGIAEVIWTVYALWLYDQLPTISIGDFLWVIGYIPLYAALIIHLRTLKTSPTTLQRWIIGGIGLAWVLYTGMVGIRPILTDFDPERLLESLVMLSYPIGDLGLVVLASITLFMMQGGRYALSWRMVFFGIFLMAFSDILYNYAIWNELYYQDNQVNLITNLVDTTYILAYLLSGFGVYLYSVVWRIKELPEMRIVTTPSALFHCFVGTNGENEIISTSENYGWLMNAKNNTSFYRVPLHEAWGVDAQNVRAITEEIIRQGKMYQEPMTLITLDKKSQPVMLSALATYDTEKAFTGINIVLQANVAVPAELKQPQMLELQAISKHVLFAASANFKEEDKALRSYFLEAFRMLLSVLYQFGGDQYKDELFNELNQTIQQNNWPARIDDEVIEISEDCEGRALSVMLAELLQTTQNLISKTIGSQVVREKMNEFEQEMGSNLPSSLDRNRLKLHAL